MLFSGIITIIKGINIFLHIIGDCGCVKVFKLLVYLGVRAYIVILFGALCACNLSLSRLPFCLVATAFYRVSVEFLFKLL